MFRKYTIFIAGILCAASAMALTDTANSNASLNGIRLAQSDNAAKKPAKKAKAESKKVDKDTKKADKKAAPAKADKADAKKAASAKPAEQAIPNEIKQMGVSALNAEMKNLIAAKKFVEARPYVDELLKRFAGSENTDESARKAVPTLYYFKAYSYFQDYANTREAKPLNEAIKCLNKILSLPKNDSSRNAIDLLSTCYIHQKKYKQAADTLGKLLEKPYVNDLSDKERLSIVRRIAQSLYSMRSWKGSDKWFTMLLNASNLPEDKILAASGLIQSAISEKKYDQAKKYFPYMVINEPARYDVSLNVALLQAAMDLATDKVHEYNTAAIFYSMVYDQDQLIAFFEQYKKKLSAQLERAKATNPDNPIIADLNGKISVAEQQLNMLTQAKPYTEYLMFGKAQNYLKTDRDYESFWAYKQLIDKFPKSSEMENYYYLAFLGAYKIGKSDEMFKLGQTYMETFPKGRYIKDVSLQIAIYYNEKGMKDEFFAIAKEFVPKYHKDKSCESMIYLMGKAWIDDQKYDELKVCFKGYLSDYGASPIADALLYWSGLANLVTGSFDNAYKDFDRLVSKFSTSPYAEDAAYRKAIAAYGKQDLNLAQELFAKFIDTYLGNELCGEAEFFLGDINLSSGYVKEALQHYSEVEKKTSSQSYIDQAYFQSISIYEKADDNAAIIKLADQYEKKYPNGNIAMIEFHKSAAFSRSARQTEALLELKNLIEKYGNEKQLDGVDKALERYVADYPKTKATLEASVKFLKDVISDEKLLNTLVTNPAERYRFFLKNSKIDNALYLKFKSDEKYSVNLFKDKKPLQTLLKHYEKQLSMFPKQAPKDFYASLLKSSEGKKPTLYYRMMMALDKFCKAPIPAKAFNEDDYKLSSPATLIWIAKHNEAYGIEAAKKTYQYVLDSESDAQYMLEAILGLAALDEKQGKWEDALKQYIRAEEEYSTDPKIAQVAIKHGEMLVKLGRYNEADKKFESIRKTPDWRGEPYAAALYNQALLAERAKKYEKALNYYDNCAIGYSNCLKYSGKAALAEAKLLVRMGDIEKAKETCDAYLKTPDAAASPEHDQIVNYKNTL